MNSEHHKEICISKHNNSNTTTKIQIARLVPLFQPKTGVFKKAKPSSAFGEFIKKLRFELLEKLKTKRATKMNP